MSVKCKQCPKPIYFETLSELRKHQWHSHGAMYARNKGKRKTTGLLISQLTSKQRENKTFTCKHCGEKTRGYKAMMRHSWTHKETFKGARGEKFREQAKELMPTVRMLKETNGEATHVLEPVINKEMTAKELLDKLYAQRDFMNSVTKLIEGMLIK